MVSSSRKTWCANSGSNVRSDFRETNDANNSSSSSSSPSTTWKCTQSFASLVKSFSPPVPIKTFDDFGGAGGAKAVVVARAGSSTASRGGFLNRDEEGITGIDPPPAMRLSKSFRFLCIASSSFLVEKSFLSKSLLLLLVVVVMVFFTSSPVIFASSLFFASLLLFFALLLVVMFMRARARLKDL